MDSFLAVRLGPSHWLPKLQHCTLGTHLSQKCPDAAVRQGESSSKWGQDIGHLVNDRVT